MTVEQICSAVESLIEECTAILGWCFNSDQVAETKNNQKEVENKN